MTTPTTVQVRLQIRADTAANWQSVNPILLANELGLESDTKKFKVGNGSNTWTQLTYFPSVVSGGTVLGNLEIGATGTLRFEGSTADGYETTLGVVDPTADRTILLPNQSGTVVVGGNASITDADIAANAEIAVSKLANGTANQVLVTDGTDVSWSDNLTLAGDLTVNGTTTTINTETLTVKDKNIELAVVDTPTDVTADGGGITLKGTTDKTINWVDATDAWTSSERFSVPLGSAAAPSLTFTGDENTGIYSPGADQLALSTNGTGRLFVDASGQLGVGTSSPSNTLHVNSGAVGTSTLLESTGSGSYLGIKNSSGQWTLGATTTSFILENSGGTALTVDSSRRVGIGSSSPGSWNANFNGPMAVIGSTANTACGAVLVSSASSRLDFSDGTGAFDQAPGAIVYNHTNNSFAVSTNNSTAITVDSSQRVGIGTSSPGENLHIKDAGFAGIIVQSDRTTAADNIGGFILRDSVGNNKSQVRGTVGGDLAFDTNATEAARIDSSGRLLVGTSTAQGNSTVTIEQTAANSAPLALRYTTTNDNQIGIDFYRSRSSSAKVENTDPIMRLDAYGYDGSAYRKGASIEAIVDAATSAGDMPCRLVFSTTADGASSPTEACRINSKQELLVGKTVSDNTSAGLATFTPGSEFYLSLVHNSVNSAQRVLLVNRQNSDGHLIDFLQAGTIEGTISVSGTTVTYGGGHLARWSQLPNNEDPSEILKGTVMSNLDEMCEWIEEDNEQLNKTKISDVEGDKNVAGVFVATSFSDDGPLDFFIGMTGDMVIRIAEGVTVERGDLLMSAGDGTAKPQDDDIVRNKTIAKVTSTNVSCTYDDGSYCVPCVLMAC